MRMFFKICMATCLVAGLLVSSGRAQTAATQEVKVHDPADLEIGKTAPEIEALDLDSKSFKLSDYRGKVVVLDFWGDW